MDYDQKPLKLFIKYMAKHKKLFFIDMLCVLIVCAIDIIFPYISKISLNILLPQKLYTAFFTVLGIMIAAYLLKGILYYIITVVGHRFGVLTEADMRKDIFSHMQELSCSFFDVNRTGVLLSRITTDLFDVTELAHHGPENLLICTITILGAIAVMFSLNWKLALVLALSLPLCLWFTLTQRVRMKETNIEVKKKTGIISAAIESSISGIRTSKAFANEEIESRKFEDANELFRNAKVDYYKSMGLFQSGMEFTTGVMPVLVILVGGILIMNGELDYVDLVTFTLYVATFVSPLRKLTMFAEQYMAGAAGFSRFLEIMRTKPEITDAPDAKEMKQIDGHIEYKDVSFAYGNGVEILKNINLEIEPGKCLAVVGSSGGGKTTLCQLLPRFYDVCSGKILIDGNDIRTFTQRSLRANIGIIQQDVFMFAGTVKDNILYGKPDATDEEIVKAAKLAEIHDDILSFPNGYDTYIGERGVMLSGGQKQRVSIARIFLKNPGILILDEATSALDSVTEKKIQRSLEKLCEGRTSIIVAHRLSTISGADEIAVVEDETIVEKGTHRELMELNGKYAGLYKAQNSEEG